jgi:DNA modification methylase
MTGWKNEILEGDCLELMKDIPDNSIDSIITDPPYGLSFMGKKWDYDVPPIEVWQECLRVLKPGGHLLSFAGTRTYHRMVVRIEDAGFEIRDMIAWVYGSGFPKSLNIGKAADRLQGNERKVMGKSNRHGGGIVGNGTSYEISPEVPYLTKGTSEWEGWGTALKPALEPITVARKPLSEKTVAENCLKWGTGGINIDGCRVNMSNKDTETLEAKSSKNPTGKKAENVPFVEGIASRPHTLGRFPANLIHDGSEEVVSLFPQTIKGNGKPIYNKANKKSKNAHIGYVRPNSSMFTDDQIGGLRSIGDFGSAARFFYCAKASKSERGINNNHPTVKPVKLIQYLIRLVTPPNGIVLDPFAGSGTTALAATKENRQYIAIEKQPEYTKIIKNRVKQIKTQTTLF